MMNEYVNEKTIVKDQIYEMFGESITCPLCFKLMIEQVMCINCQNVYCKNCIEDWKKKGGGCPNHCEDAVFKDVIERNNNITKFKFKCIKGCGEEIPFKEIKNHYSSNCMSKKKKIKVLNKAQAAKYQKKGKKGIPHLTSMPLI